MPTSALQITANRNNAKKSTGAKTTEGKNNVAKNALKHGIFAKQLLLSDENPEDYQCLLDDLHHALNPVGALELSLVERIAVSLWRQRRLIRSETAHIELSNKPSVIAAAVNTEMNWLSPEQKITKYDLTEFDQEHYQWCQSVYQEFSAIVDDKNNINNLTNLEFLKKHAPAIYKTLQKNAEEEQHTMDEYLKSYDNPIEYFMNLIQFCKDEIKQTKLRPLVLEIAQTIRNKQAILQQIKVREALAKYQVMLDNELYKAMKALRDTQAYRLNSL